MSTYKVLQDIEAEDKLLGPLTLRQFIYAAIAVIAAFVGFKLLLINFFLVIPFLPIVVLFGVLAAPFGHDQPNEVWLLARARFFLKPRKRIWNQSNFISDVIITVPKKIEQHLTKDLTPDQARSKLEQLANTIDTRGWSAKNVNINLSDQSSDTFSSSDRLISPDKLPQAVPNDDITAADDILDEKNNLRAQQLDQKIVSSSETYKQKVIASVSSKPSKAKPSPMFTTKFTKPISRHVLATKPITKTAPSKKPTVTSAPARPPETPATDPAILGLALANDKNWTVATVAHQAEQAKKKEPPDEVVISLH